MQTCEFKKPGVIFPLMLDSNRKPDVISIEWFCALTAAAVNKSSFFPFLKKKWKRMFLFSCACHNIEMTYLTKQTSDRKTHSPDKMVGVRYAQIKNSVTKLFALLKNGLQKFVNTSNAAEIDTSILCGI